MVVSGLYLVKPVAQLSLIEYQALVKKFEAASWNLKIITYIAEQGAYKIGTVTRQRNGPAKQRANIRWFSYGTIKKTRIKDESIYDTDKEFVQALFVIDQICTSLYFFCYRVLFCYLEYGPKPG